MSSMPKAAKKKNKPRQQFGVAPYRSLPDGGLEVLLVTSRDTGRWIIPKGWPMKKGSPLKAALREGFEEAGVRGDGGAEIGAFEYVKVMEFGRDRPCRVGVFALKVTEELEDWPEREERVRRWFTPAEAAAAVNEDGLKEILETLPTRLKSD